jgi:hypothetical protein
MKVRISPVVLLVFGLAWTAVAQSGSPMREGKWEVLTRMSLPGMEGAPPMKHEQCITAAMIKDPQWAIRTGPGGGDNDCTVTNYKLGSNSATYTMSCSMPMAISGTGEIKYAGSEAYTGTFVMDAGGQKITLSYDAKRVGDCAK